MDGLCIPELRLIGLSILVVLTPTCWYYSQSEHFQAPSFGSISFTHGGKRFCWLFHALLFYVVNSKSEISLLPKASAGPRRSYIFPSKERLSQEFLNRSIPGHISLFITSSWCFPCNALKRGHSAGRRPSSVLRLFQIYTRSGIKYMQKGFMISELSVTLSQCRVSKCCTFTLGFLSLLLPLSKVGLALA